MSFDFGDLASAGTQAATGNYIGAAVSAVGFGMSLFGGMSQADVAKQQAEVSGDIAKQEQGINAQKQQAMELAGRRQNMEIYRKMQQDQALALNSATNQGAQFGSGIQGGLAQVTDQSLFNAVGVNSALQTGRAIAGYNDAISNDKIKLASLGGQAATDAGYASLGGSLLKAGPTIGNLSGNALGSLGRLGNSGNYSGTPGSSISGGLY